MIGYVPKVEQYGTQKMQFFECKGSERILILYTVERKLEICERKGGGILKTIFTLNNVTYLTEEHASYFLGCDQSLKRFEINKTKP